MTPEFARTTEWTSDASPQVDSAFWTLLAACVLGAGLFIADMDWRISTYEDFAPDAEVAEMLVASGSGGRKVAFGAIGLLGAALLWAAPRGSFRPATLPLLALGGYLLICVVSVVWSDNPALTTKRVAILLFCWLGVIGVTARLQGRALLHLAAMVSAMLITIGLVAEFQQGTFRPWESGYRFAGTVHPNSQGATCAILAIASFFLARDARRGRLAYVILAIAALAFLWLTKSRTSLAGFLFGLGVAWLLGRSAWTRTLAGIAAPLAIVTLLMLGLFQGIDMADSADSAARLGRSELESGLGSLNGRWPLWLSLSEYVQERWILGYGYHGFWSPERIYEISIEQGWTLATAHSALLDVTLSVGLLGASFFVVAVATGLWAAVRRCSQGDAVDGFVAAVALFALVSGIFESGIAQPASIDAFVASCGLAYAVSRTRQAGNVPSVPRASTWGSDSPAGA